MVKLGWKSEYVKNIVRIQNEDLMSCWNVEDGKQPLIAISCLDYIKALARNSNGDIIEYRNNRGALQGFWWQKEDGEPECWVDKNLTSRQYRRAYHQFLRYFYGLGRNDSLSSEVVVEHVMNASRAKKNFSNLLYLRVTVAHTSVNTTFGSQWEANFQNNERAAMDYDYYKGGINTFGGVSLEKTSPNTMKSQQTYQIIWPLTTKAFDIKAPRGNITDEYILNTLERLIDIRMIPEECKEDSYGSIRHVFMMGQRNLPHYDGGGRIYTDYVPSEPGRGLTNEDSLKDWLSRYPRRPQNN